LRHLDLRHYTSGVPAATIAAGGSIDRTLQLHHPAIVHKICDYCRVLQADGMDVGDYLEQLTYLLFLKAAHERSLGSRKSPALVPDRFAWPTLVSKQGEELLSHYRAVLEYLSAAQGTLGLVFSNARNAFKDPAKLRQVIVELIDAQDWSAMRAYVKERGGETGEPDTGSFHHITPRALMRTLLECVGCRKAN
jgi:type I restriction enzyme M protein